MILSDVDILESLKRKEIVIDPLNTELVGPCSVDLRLSDKFVIFKSKSLIDPYDFHTLENAVEIIETKGRPFILMPKQFVLAYTLEKIAISKSLAATLEGRSSIARLGIVVHAAGLVSPGSGMLVPKPLVLEVFSQSDTPVKLYPGMRIVQIIFHRLTSPVSMGYDEDPRSSYSKKNVWISRRAFP